MKRFLSILTMVMAFTVAFAQDNQPSARDLGREQQKLNEFHMKLANTKPSKDAKKRAKQLKKEGWKEPAGEKSIEKQLTEADLYAAERTLNDRGQNVRRYYTHTAMGTAGSYNVAYAAARSTAQAEIASQLRTKLFSAIKRNADNEQNSAIDATTVEEFHERGASIVDETLTNGIPVVAIYRVLPNNNYQVQMRLVFDRTEFAAQLKKNMQKKLKAQGDNAFDGIVEEVMQDLN